MCHLCKDNIKVLFKKVFNYNEYILNILKTVRIKKITRIKKII